MRSRLRKRRRQKRVTGKHHPRLEHLKLELILPLF
jgi:hypothetical protein